MTNSKVTEDIWFNYLYLKLRFIFAYTNYIQSTAITSDYVVSITQINESLRVSDTKRGAAGNIRVPRRGAWTTEGNLDYSSPHPCKACEAKEGIEEHRFSIHLFILLFNYIVLITIIWQNLGGREGRAYAP